MKAKKCFGVNQLSRNLRIKRSRWYLPALWGSCFLLQKRGFMGLWYTKSWIYVEMIKDCESDYIEQWLIWDSGIEDEE